MFRRIFLSPKTMAAATITTEISCIAVLVCGILAGTMDLFIAFAVGTGMLLSAFLFLGYRKHSIMSMQAGCCGLLLTLVFIQGIFVFMELPAQDMDFYILQGFWGCMFLCSELTVFILEILITVNHYYFYIGNRITFLRTAYNQMLIYVMSFFSVFNMVIDILLFPDLETTVYDCASVLSVLACFVMISCAELIIALDADERGCD